MIDREKVIRHIIAEIGIAKLCKKEFASVDIDMLSDALELLKEQESILEMPNDDGWISVEDHLPEEEGTYIAYSRDEGRDSCAFSVGEARYCHVGRNDERKWRGSYGFTYDVTHWRPFPPPPNCISRAKDD